jgi:hypothetical protein
MGKQERHRNVPFLLAKIFDKVGWLSVICLVMQQTIHAGTATTVGTAKYFNDHQYQIFKLCAQTSSVSTYRQPSGLSQYQVC